MEKTKSKNTRRDFLVKMTLGTGVMVGMTMASCNPMRRMMFDNFESLIGDYAIEESPMTWFEITAQNEIIFHSPKVEMGQGAFTGLAQIAAEELEVDIDRVNIIHASTSGRPVDPRSTGGSDSISALYTPLRQLAANFREMLRTNAAGILGVSAASLKSNNGGFSANNKSITYGEIVQQVTEWEIPKEDAPLKERKDFKVIGKSLPRVDLMPKIMGDPIFGIDVALPGMLYGVVKRPPKIDTTFVSADASEAKSMPGVVQIVNGKDFVAVVAKSRPEAEMAVRAIKVEWKTNKNWQHQEIVDMTKVGSGKEYLVQKEGSKVQGDDILEAEYSTPAGAHAQMEPNGSVADVRDGKATVYISTQVPKFTMIEIAEALGYEEDKVEVIPTYLGGAFGRRLHTPNGIQAALISKAVGKPVHVYYSRKDEFQSAEFRPPTHHTLKGTINSSGKIEAIEHNTSSGSHIIGSVIMPDMMTNMLGADIGTWAGGRVGYDIENIRVSAWRLDLPFSTTMWRAPGLMANTFALESFIDELAHKAGKDPVDFRIEHYPDTEKGEIQKNVLKAVAEKAGWGKPLPEGRAQGVAQCYELGAAVAQVVEVSIQNDEIKVDKVTCALDPGFAINPDSIKAQVEGAIIMGASASIYEKMIVKDSKITPTIFGPYRMAMMKDSPKEIDIVILESGGRPVGVGEPPIGPIGAAIANAVFALTGKRLRSMPLNDALNA